MNDDLLCCPFCGQPARWQDDPLPSGLRYGVGCSNEGCLVWTGYGVKLFKTEQEAIDAWNERANPTCHKLPSSGDKVCTVTHVKSGMSMEFGYWKCSACGCENFEGARYCMSCGCEVKFDPTVTLSDLYGIWKAGR